MLLRPAQLILVVLLSGVATRAIANPYRQECCPALPRQCAVEGRYVSLMVEVRGADDTRTEVAVNDVHALVAFERDTDDVTVRVVSLPRIRGRFVSRAGHGLSVFATRAFASDDGALRVAPDMPFELVRRENGPRAFARIPAPNGDGHIEFAVPCDALSAGAPVAVAPSPSADRRERLIAIANGSRIHARPDVTTSEIARVVASGDPAGFVAFVGRIRRAQRGFVRVELAAGGARFDGYVSASSAMNLGTRVRDTSRHPRPIRQH